MPYAESKDFWREPSNPPNVGVDLYASDPTLEDRLLEHLEKSVTKGNLQMAIQEIDKFAKDNWMMNLGPEKAKIIKNYCSYKPIKKILQIGGYCGYSALTFALLMPQATIHTVEISPKYGQIAKKIQTLAGTNQRSHVHIGTVSTLQQQIKKNGPYDMIFIDHVKNLYLSDFVSLEKYGVIQKGTIVIGDNIITPGSPDYWAHFKENADYDSILQHSYVEYCDIPDAVLISERITEFK